MPRHSPHLQFHYNKHPMCFSSAQSVRYRHTFSVNTSRGEVQGHFQHKHYNSTSGTGTFSLWNTTTHCNSNTDSAVHSICIHVYKGTSTINKQPMTQQWSVWRYRCGAQSADLYRWNPRRLGKGGGEPRYPNPALSPPEWFCIKLRV